MKKPSQSSLDRWNEVLTKYRQRDMTQSQWDDETVSSEDTGLIMMFFDIIAHAITGHKARDRWSDFISVHPFGRTAIKKSTKHGVEYRFGISYDQIYVESWIVHSRHIRLMSDDFWRTILEMQDCGDVCFEPSITPKLDAGRRSQRELGRSEASAVFTMIRNYILLMETRENEYDDPSLGSIRVEWPADVAMCETCDRACKAFSGLYRMNSLLHRSWSAEFKANLRRQFHAMTQEQQCMYGSCDAFVRDMQRHIDEK